MRVYQIAKKTGKSSRYVTLWLRRRGIQIKSPSSAINEPILLALVIEELSK